MKRLIILFLMVAGLLAGRSAFAQTEPSDPSSETERQDGSGEIDSLRRAEEEAQDSVVFTAKYIRYTLRRYLDDSIYTVPLDTSLRNLQNYNPQYDPYAPSLNLGNFGLSTRDMLFSQRKNIGFDAGFHSLDRFLFTQDSVKYYRARTPFTQLWYISGSQPEQFFQLTHTQNIKPNWNVGAVYRRIGANGIYQAQRADHTNVMAFTWYYSPNGRYNLTASAIYNTLKAGENGSIADDNFFITNKPQLSGALIGPTKLRSAGGNRPAQTWKRNEFSFKQSYNVGRIDSLGNDSLRAILPTQRFSHEFTYSTNRFRFFRNESQIDTARVFPTGMVPDSVILTRDSTHYSRLSNEFRYSFYLRGSSVSFIKNEMKLDVGLRHEFYHYDQLGDSTSFQNTTLLANAGYRFSDRVQLEADLQQIVQGRDAGNFLYQATTSFQLSKAAGRILLGAYVLNRSPEQIFEKVNYQFHKWNLKLNNSKTSNLSFEYENTALRLRAKAEYFLLNNYIYLAETSTPRQVSPVQLSTNINLLKMSAGNVLTYRKLTLENYFVYQKTDYQDVLLTPEAYLYTSFYRSQRFFRSIDTQIGLDSRYNTPFNMPWYAVNIGQFYSGRAADYEMYPVVDVWLKASLRRATLMLKQSFINQGLFSNGYYTVNRYPMPNRLFVFGVKWNFYN
jgi:hypothetical protein